MTWPLMILAFFSIFVGWPITLGLPFFGYEPVLEGMLAYGEPLRALNLESAKLWAFGASILIMTAGIGLGGAYYAPFIWWKRFDPKRMANQFAGAHVFLMNKWYFDEIYDRALVRPTLALSSFARNVDKRLIDGIVDGSAAITVLVSKLEGGFDLRIVDGIVNLVAQVTYVVGDWSRVLQTGRLRNYLMFLALAVVGLFLGVLYWIQAA